MNGWTEGDLESIRELVGFVVGMVVVAAEVVDLAAVVVVPQEVMNRQ
jgi:hypothetical protein